jgi:hypothetical protein
MSASGITLAAGSARPFTLSLLDKSNQPVDLTSGTWRADLYIIEYPGASSSPFAQLSTSAGTGILPWLSFGTSSVILTPDPVVTKLWSFYKYHYDLYLTGPNATVSKAERVDHGPFRLDK